MVSASALRVVFFGTPGFAVPSLEAILGSPHEVVGVVTQPDRPRGRGQKTTDGPVKHVAIEAGLPVLQPERLRDDGFLAALSEMRADIGVVAAYGKILSETVLQIPRFGMVNVHASLLPRYRGAAPVHRAIIAGEFETGVTIMRVVKALDAGPMIDAVARPIEPDETSVDVEAALAALGANLLLGSLDQLAAGTANEIPQDEAAATYASRLTKEDGIIDWSHTARQIHDRIRGLHPWPHAFSFVGAQRLIFHRSWVTDEASTKAPGTIIAAHGDDLRIAAGDKVLAISEIQAEGKRPMTPRDFLPGHRLEVGAVFNGS